MAMCAVKLNWPQSGIDLDTMPLAPDEVFQSIIYKEPAE